MKNALRPWLQGYAEWVIRPQGMEMITGGRGENCARALAEIAERSGASADSIEWFINCHRSFPDSQLGLKLSAIPGGPLPSLYLRIKASLGAGMEFLKARWGRTSAILCLKERLAANQVFYGMGFFERAGESMVKTYTLQALPPRRRTASKGFVSYRLSSSDFSEERKYYYPDYELQDLDEDPQWKPVSRLIWRELGIRKASHLGVIVGEHESKQVYLERVGAIATDFSAV